jgi:hypothetical protein
MSHEESLDRKFEQFLRENPQVFRQFRLLAVKLKAKGIERYSAKALWEVMRWQLLVQTNAPLGSYRLNNSFVSRLARKLMEEEEFADFFETRRLKSECPPPTATPEAADSLALTTPGRE